MATPVTGQSNSWPMNGTDSDKLHAEANSPTPISTSQDHELASTQQQQQQPNPESPAVPTNPSRVYSMSISVLLTPGHQSHNCVPQPSPKSPWSLPNLNLNMNQPPFTSCIAQPQLEELTTAPAVNDSIEKEAAHQAPASASQSISKRGEDTRRSRGMAMNAGNLANLLPTGTVLIFQALTPSLSNNGKCDILNKWLVGFTLGCCALACFLSSFTDSVEVSNIDGQKKIYYGFVWRRGLCVLNADGEEGNFENKTTAKEYQINAKDCMHALASLIVFLIFACSSTEVVDCFFPGVGEKEYSVIIYMPLVAGVLSTCFFTLFPTTRKGIGYAAAGAATAVPNMRFPRRSP